MRFLLTFRHAIRILPIVLWSLHLTSPLAQASDPAQEKSSLHFYVVGTGLLLMAGGGAFAYYQNSEADHAMNRYRQSAFTENTLPARKRVEDHEKLTWMGIAVFTAGGLLLVVSF